MSGTNSSRQPRGSPVTRRDFLASGGGAVAGLAVGLPGPLPALHAPGSPDRTQDTDILVRGGRVIDPSQGLDGSFDVGIRSGLVADLAPEIDPAGWREVIDADGRIVTPGLVDLHVHVYPGVSHYGISADRYCLSRGATTVLDAGSAGAQTFDGFRRYVIDEQETRIRALLNISVTGTLTDLRGELRDLEYADVGRAMRTVEEHRDLVLGIKVRAGGESGPNDMAGTERALEVAEAFGLPIMLHITRTVTPIGRLLGLLREGDILTHSFRLSGTPGAADQGILTGEGVVRDSALAALERGVVFDVGHGGGSFSFDAMEMAMRQGVLPGTISSDVHTYNVGADGPVYDLATTLSKFLALGLPLAEVVRKATEVPAGALAWGVQIGTLRAGAEGDVAIFELHTGEHRFRDAYGGVRTGSEMLVPWRTVKGGRSFLPQWS